MPAPRRTENAGYERGSAFLRAHRGMRTMSPRRVAAITVGRFQFISAGTPH